MEQDSILPNESSLITIQYAPVAKHGTQIERVTLLQNERPLSIFIKAEIKQPDAVLNVVQPDIEEIKVDNTTSVFRLFPNPVENELFLKFRLDEPQELSVQLLNTMGQVITTQQINDQNGVLNIDTSKLPSGVYQVMVSDKETLLFVDQVAVVKN